MSDRTPELADIIRQAIEDRLAEVHVMLPGRIDAYDAATQKADVEPLIKRLQRTVDGEIREDLPIIPGVPVAFPRAGGFKITMPVNAGDRCMLVFCERSTEAYQIGQERKGTSDLILQTDPQTFEMHNLTDAVAVMGWYNDAEALSSPDSTDMVLGEEGGPVIHIGGDLVQLYQKGGGNDFVALAQKVFDELDALKQTLDSWKTTNETHTHAHIDGIVGPSLTSFPSSVPAPPHLPGTTWTTPAAVQSVAADKVKAI